MEASQSITKMDMCCPEDGERPDASQMMTDCDVPEESQPCLGTNSLTTTDCPAIPPFNTELSPPFSSQPDDILRQDNEMDAQTARREPNKGDKDQDAVEVENKLWELRSNRVKEILSVLQKEFKYLWRLGTTVLEFDIGFLPKQNYSANRLTSFILFKVTCFALAMSSSQLEFIWEILENKFDLGQQSESNKKTLAFQVMKTVKELRNREDKVKLSQEMLELPDFLSDKNTFQKYVGVKTEPETDLNLSVNSCEPNNKLPINKLNKGAMTDVVNCAEKLCGSFEEIFIDVLRHNFDLDLQSADCDLARNILSQIPLVIERRKAEQSCKRMQVKNSSCSIIIDCHRAYTEACSPGPIVAIQNQKTSEDSNIEARNDPELLMWKLRASQIQQLLSMLHKEQCPLDPYTRCKKLGIDFNVGSGQKQKLDQKLLTNGIMIELFSFANSLLSSAEYFLTEIMEYNFHLKFESPQHRRAFAKKLKKQVTETNQGRLTKHYLERLFELPDLTCIGEYTPFCPKCSYEPNMPGYMLQDDPNPMSEVESIEDWTEQKPTILPIFTFPASEVLTESNRCCRKAGLSLCVDKNYPRMKMDKWKLTYEVIFDAYRFSKKLCGSKHKILTDLIQHNFNVDGQPFVKCPWFVFVYEMKSYDGEATWFDTAFDLKLVFKEKLKRKSEMTTMLRDRRLDTKRMVQSEQMEETEWFPQQTSNFPGYDVKMEQFEEEIEWFPHQSGMCTDPSPVDNSYMCPVEEESDSERDSERLRQMQGEEEEGHVDINAPSECDVVQEERQMQGEEEEAHVDINAPSECELVQEETLTETNMWKWRASRVKEILSDLNQDFLVYKLKLVNLDFNVGLQPKQKLSAERLSSRDLFKTALFALSLNASQQEFIMEILKKNFDLGLQNDCHEKFFARELMSGVRELINSEPSVKYSKMMFTLPDLSLKTLQDQSSDIVKTEPSDEPITRESVSPVAPPTLPAVTELDSLPKTPQNMKDLYPFCEAIGLKLNTKSPQPIKQLDICRLTNGAMTEVVNFAERLCGTFEQICMDVLRHNFDFDFQSTDSDLARSIFAQIPLVVEQRNYHHSFMKGSASKTVSCIPILNNAGSTDLVQSDENPSVSKTNNAEVQNDPNLILWKLRANQIKQILTVPHTEQCPLYSYSRCKKLGIDFNVGSGLKRSLDPQLLTNGIMVELFTFADALLSSSHDFITEILEYNVDLNLNDELRRGAFANYIRSSCQIKNKHLRRKFLKKVFVWPVLEYLKYPTPHCLKCYKIRNGIIPLVGSAPATTDPASADANGKKLENEKAAISSFSATEMLTEGYSSCKKVGLNLIVDRDHPTIKLKTSELTVEILREIDSFAKKLSGTRFRIVNDILKHNFFSHMLTVLKGDNGPGYYTYKLEGAGEPNWFSETAKLVPGNVRQPVNPTREALKRLQREETLTKRQLHMQETKEKKRKTVPKGHPSARAQSDTESEMDGMQHGAQLPQLVSDGYRTKASCPNQAMTRPESDTVQPESTCL